MLMSNLVGRVLQPEHQKERTGPDQGGLMRLAHVLTGPPVSQDGEPLQPASA
jgi:hypothetical protein